LILVAVKELEEHLLIKLGRLIFIEAANVEQAIGLAPKW